MAKSLKHHVNTVVCVYQLDSRFDEFYYNREEKPMKINCNRPFYMDYWRQKTDFHFDDKDSGVEWNRIEKDLRGKFQLHGEDDGKCGYAQTTQAVE